MMLKPCTKRALACITRALYYEDYLFFFQQIMKDRWINVGSEEDELKPFVEPEQDITDQKRIGTKQEKNCSCYCASETQVCRQQQQHCNRITLTI